MQKEKDIIIKSTVDTFQTKDYIENREKMIEYEGMEGYVNKFGELITKWNPNKIDGYKNYNYSLENTKQNIQELYSKATVLNVDDMIMNRIDICTDVDWDFVENSKFIDLLHKCLTADLKGKRWFNVNDETKSISNFIFKNRDYEIEFYNKKEESKNKHKYDTRLEIRRKRVKNQNIEYHIDKNIEKYKNLVEKLEYVENVEVKRLCKIWDKEKGCQSNLKFTSFVYKYNQYFYTRNILKEVYKHVGLKGALSGWLKDFKKNYKIELYTKTMLENFSKEIIKSLREYKKS